jgi:hypothetical protein
MVEDTSKSAVGILILLKVRQPCIAALLPGYKIARAAGMISHHVESHPGTNPKANSPHVNDIIRIPFVGAA